eukprot:8758761-Pyramimonas_sp.AAC.1
MKELGQKRQGGRRAKDVLELEGLQRPILPSSEDVQLRLHERLQAIGADRDRPASTEASCRRGAGPIADSGVAGQPSQPSSW